MYIIREPEAQKIRYFAKIVENSQKSSIFTTIVVNEGVAECQSAEASILGIVAHTRHDRRGVPD